MNHFSVVIICKNEEAGIGRVLQSVAGLTDDVLVYDNGSTDGTLTVLKQFGVRVHQGEWTGYGKTKQTAVGLAKYDWVLNIDADEALDETLQQSLQTANLSDAAAVYEVKFKNMLGEKHLRWGEWGADKHIRLFNRTQVNWNDAPVHEALVMPASFHVKRLPGAILHRTVKDTVDYSNKMVKYALLNAEKYFVQGRRSSWVNRYFSPRYSFVKHYIVQLGFLDGWAGLLSARMSMFYTFLKYARLHELWQSPQHPKGSTAERTNFSNDKKTPDVKN